jgi:ectoine hydroxylase-related dioxygenase (phytanoyl-CoA dioxygenase family)
MSNQTILPELPARAMTVEEIESYRRDGVVCLRQIYSPAWVSHLTGAIEDICAKPSPFGGKPSQRFRQDPFTWMLSDAIRDFVLRAPTAHLMQQAFGSKKVNYFYDQIFVKRQLTPDPTGWHHDLTFWPIEGDQIASLWTSVDAVDANSSALEFVAGSHRWPQRFKAIGMGGVVFSTEAPDAMPDIEAERDKYKILSWELEPGDGLLFHGLTVHGSRGNRSPNVQRRALTTRWCGDDVVYFPRGRQMPIPWSHGLSKGDPLGGFLFPQVLPETDLHALEQRMKGPIKPEFLRMAKIGLQMLTAERVPA